MSSIEFRCEVKAPADSKVHTFLQYLEQCFTRRWEREEALESIEKLGVDTAFLEDTDGSEFGYFEADEEGYVGFIIDLVPSADIELFDDFIEVLESLDAESYNAHLFDSSSGGEQSWEK
ncbi:MAG: hypothetical protein H7A01_18360 [Hahellaceae bacterium]|nr:hypothetical protein [Hahellaceae bacterium]MCP5213051.1 hypothetical protein [Hahellaceae bacterium]